VFWNSHVFVNFSPASTWVSSGTVTSPKRIAASVQFAETVAARVGVTESSADDSGVTVKVAGMSRAFVGISVAVTKLCVGVGVPCASIAMDTQDVRKIEIRIVRRVFFAIDSLKE
jgi:hypothetical protein